MTPQAFSRQEEQISLGKPPNKQAPRIRPLQSPPLPRLLPPRPAPRLQHNPSIEARKRALHPPQQRRLAAHRRGPRKRDFEGFARNPKAQKNQLAQAAQKLHRAPTADELSQ